MRGSRRPLSAVKTRLPGCHPFISVQDLSANRIWLQHSVRFCLYLPIVIAATCFYKDGADRRGKDRHRSAVCGIYSLQVHRADRVEDAGGQGQATRQRLGRDVRGVLGASARGNGWRQVPWRRPSPIPSPGDSMFYPLPVIKKTCIYLLYPTHRHRWRCDRCLFISHRGWVSCHTWFTWAELFPTTRIFTVDGGHLRWTPPSPSSPGMIWTFPRGFQRKFDSHFQLTSLERSCSGIVYLFDLSPLMASLCLHRAGRQRHNMSKPLTVSAQPQMNRYIVASDLYIILRMWAVAVAEVYPNRVLCWLTK